VNFHHQPGSAGSAATRIVRYEPVSGREGPGRAGAVEQLAALTSAPLMGSRLIFPSRFGRAFRCLAENPAADPAIIPEHAIWYFGAALHLEVDPLSLKRRIADWVHDERGAMRWVGSAFLDAADWSAALTPLAKSPIHREMQEIVAAGKNLRDTRVYRTFLRAIALGRPSRRNNVVLDNAEAIEAYLHYCRDLIKSMRKRGVVRHSRSFAFHRLRLKHRDARSPVHDSTERDIGVAVAADGELIRHLGGKHRTAIALALKLPSLPVEVRMVHVQWLARQVERTGLPPHLALVDGLRELSASHRPAGDRKPSP
jgi:hypothetical protein